MANPVDLKFWRQVTPTPGAVDLRFGGPPASNEVAGTLSAALPPAVAPALTFAAEQFVARTLGALATALPAATLPALTLASAAVDYDQALPDAIGPGLTARAQQGATIAPAGLAATQQQFLPTGTPATAQHTAADPLHIGAAARQQHMLAASRASAQRWQHGHPLGAGSSARHGDKLRQRHATTAPAQHGLPLVQGARSEYQERIRFRHRLRTDQQHGTKAGTGTSTGHHNALPVAKGAAVRHQQMIPLPLGWWQIAYPWPAPPFDPNAPSSPVHLRFCRINDGTHALIFGCRPQPGVVVPIREVYIVINTFSLVRADNGLPVDVSAFRAGLDTDSWGWSWSAQLHADLLPLVRGEPGDFVELIATINGTPIRILVESIRRDRRFANSTLAIGGRTRAAWLADPHSPTITRYNDVSLTAQQLLDAALTLNGVPLGWSLDWQIDDWLVTTGAWSYVGSYIGAATRIAEAGGAYVQAHDTDQTLIILPRYPEPPWRWHLLDPDIVLPEDVVEVEGTEWLDRPAYNAVWVGDGNRLDKVKRTGTAGDNHAQTIIDPLTTAPEATRQRGIATLSDTGHQAHIHLRLPLLPETGLIRPGQLIRYTEHSTPHVGLTRAVTLDYAGVANVWQTIRIETHELEPV